MPCVTICMQSSACNLSSSLPQHVAGSRREDGGIRNLSAGQCPPLAASVGYVIATCYLSGYCMHVSGISSSSTCSLHKLHKFHKCMQSMHFQSCDLMPLQATVDHRATVGLPESSRFAEKPGSAAKKAAATFSLPPTHMLVANAAYDPQLSPGAATTARSAAQYALQADADSEPWEGGFGAQCTASDRAVFADPAAPAGAGGMPGADGASAVVPSIQTDSDSDSSSLDFDMRGINTFREMSTDLPSNT